MTRKIVGKTSEIPPGKLSKVSSDGNDILIAYIDGNYFALDDTCSHAGSSLSEGKLEGCSIICGWHGAQFDCSNGKLVKFPAKINDLKLYNVIIESDELFVEV